MADGDYSGGAVQGREIRLTDHVVGFDPAAPSLADGGRSDSLSEIISRIFENPPAVLSNAASNALRTLLLTLTQNEVDARAAARYTDAEKALVNSVSPGANLLTPYKIGNIYRASPAGAIAPKPGNAEGTASVLGITVAPDNWELNRPEATAALPDVYDCHVYGYQINGVFSIQYGTPNRTDRYIAPGASSFSDLTGRIEDGQVPDSFTRDIELATYAALADATYAALAGATFTGETGGQEPVNPGDFATKGYVDAGDTGTTPPSPRSEEIYFGLIDAVAEAATVDITLLTMEDATVAGHNITLGPAASGQFFVILTPAAHDILTLVNSGTQADELSAYAKAEGVRNLNSESYDAYTLGPLNAGATISYRLTLTE